MSVRFEWDPRKDALNIRNHRISFDEARTAFYDVFADQFFDDDHSSDEDRFVLLGSSAQNRVLIVVHAVRETKRGEEIIRIISARKATKKERRSYRG